MTTPPPGGRPSPRWARNWLIAAGVYNLLWGTAVIALPHAIFDLAGADRMRYPEFWQCVGMIVGVYGVGYLIASSSSRTHWPIVLVGLLGKILGPIGFALALGRGAIPPVFGLTIITNDLVWWAPFAMMLWDAARSRHAPPEEPAPSLVEALRGAEDQHGRTLADITRGGPTLVVFLRHAGCTFCRETLSDLAGRRRTIAERGVEIAVVTMSAPEGNEQLAERYGLGDIAWISDPQRRLYRALDLRRGSFVQLFGPVVWLRGLAAAIRGHTPGPLEGDGFQMPGAFVLHREKVVRAFRHSTAADRPDYDAVTCELSA